MDLETLSKLRAANIRLPDNSYFAYQDTEISDFRVKPKPGVELEGGGWVSLANVNVRAIAFHFD